MENIKSQTSLSKEFIATYNQIDAHMRKIMHLKGGGKHTYMIHALSKRDKNGLFAKHKFDLLNYAKLRNAIVHNPFSTQVDTIAEPHPIIVKNYTKIVEDIINPPKALQIAVKKENIFKVNLKATVIHTMNFMLQNNYSYVPIINDNNKLIGVFSPFVIMSYLVDHENFVITNETALETLVNYLPIDKHAFEYYEFVKRNTYLSTIQKLFEQEIKDKKRLGVVFITETGSPSETILGLITAWDVAKI